MRVTIRYWIESSLLLCCLVWRDSIALEFSAAGFWRSSIIELRKQLGNRWCVATSETSVHQSNGRTEQFMRYFYERKKMHKIQNFKTVVRFWNKTENWNHQINEWSSESTFNINYNFTRLEISFSWTKLNLNWRSGGTFTIASTVWASV